MESNNANHNTIVLYEEIPGTAVLVMLHAIGDIARAGRAI